MASVVCQMRAEFPDEAVIFSCDSKAKIHIGGQAVSRYHQIRNFFLSDDLLLYCDHDFPACHRILIEPDGLLLLKSKGFDRKNNHRQNRKNGCRYSFYRATVGQQLLTILEIWQTY